jgi:alcohol dehydrogenase (cytochrome c)
VAIYKGWLYFLTPDAHLVSLNAKDGSVRSGRSRSPIEKGYWTTMAPLIVVKDNVIVGVSGDFDNLSGFLRSIDPETGQTASGNGTAPRRSEPRTAPPAA